MRRGRHVLLLVPGGHLLPGLQRYHNLRLLPTWSGMELSYSVLGQRLQQRLQSRNRRTPSLIHRRHVRRCCRSSNGDDDDAFCLKAFHGISHFIFLAPRLSYRY